jgi:hypothetical protein
MGFKLSTDSPVAPLTVVYTAGWLKGQAGKGILSFRQMRVHAQEGKPAVAEVIFFKT